MSRKQTKSLAPQEPRSVQVLLCRARAGLHTHCTCTPKSSIQTCSTRIHTLYTYSINTKNQKFATNAYINRYIQNLIFGAKLLPFGVHDIDVAIIRMKRRKNYYNHISNKFIKYSRTLKQFTFRVSTFFLTLSICLELRSKEREQ